MKKSKKDEVLNVEAFGRGNCHLEVTTKRDRFGNNYYTFFIGNKKRSGKWVNQHMLVNGKDAYILESLLRKSILFSCSFPKNNVSVPNNSKVSSSKGVLPVV